MIIFVVGACSSNPPPSVTPETAKPETYTPIPGVDSTIVARADSLAEDLFVSFEEEEEADGLLEEARGEVAESDTLFSLKKIFDLARDSSVVVTAEDSSVAIEHFNEAYDQYEKAEKLFERYREEESSESLGEEITVHLMRAREATLKSIEINPFDMDAMWLLSVIYRYLAAVFEEHQNYMYAISVLNELITMDRGDHSLYYELGFNLYQIEEWEDALTNFRRAEELLYQNTTIDFELYDPGKESIENGMDFTPGNGAVSGGVGDSADSTEWFTSVPVDTSILLSYVSGQAECLTKLYRPDEALHNFYRAMLLSPEEEKERILQRIGWINWDDGDIRNVELRDTLNALERNGEYEKAYNGYLSLLQGISRRSAVDEIEWKIATMDYAIFENRQTGVDRLKNVINRAKREGILSDEGMIVSADPGSLYPTFLEDYGTMCYNLAMDYLTEKKQRKKAFAYMLQASEINWEKRGSCFVELMKMARNNPVRLIEFGERALETDISREERTFVFKQLVTAYKRKGGNQDFDKARAYFNEWKRLVKQQE